MTNEGVFRITDSGPLSFRLKFLQCLHIALPNSYCMVCYRKVHGALEGLLKDVMNQHWKDFNSELVS